MFATLAGGYPFGPLPGATGGYAATRAAFLAGRLDGAAFAAEAERHVRAIAHEQAAAGLDLVEDAWAHVPPGVPGDGLDAVAGALLGGVLDPDGLVRAWRGLAEATGPLAMTKVVLPGPMTLAAGAARSGATTGAARRRALEVLQGSLQALAAAACPAVLLAEPELSAIGGSAAAWAQAATILEAATGPWTGVLHLGIALTGGTVEPRGDGVLAALPVASLLVDVRAGPGAWRTIGAQPAERGIIVGAADARSAELDDPEMLLWAGTLAAEHADRGSARVGIAPCGSLGGVDRHPARRKIERLGEAVRLSRMGPPGEVARALQPDPGRCRIASLRRLISDHDAVLPPIDRPRSPT